MHFSEFLFGRLTEGVDTSGAAKKVTTHISHLEDLIIDRGTDGATRAIEFIKVFLSDHHQHDSFVVTKKIDGAPAIIFGIDPTSKKFFVSTKSIFNKTPRVCFSERDIDEIDTRILDSTVLNMVIDTLLKPSAIQNYLNLGNNRKDQSKLDKEIKDIENKIKIINKQKERIIDLYSFGDLEREEYVKRISIYDEEISNLQTKRTERIKYLPLFQSSKIIEDNITLYCREAQTQFAKCSEFSLKRQFLLDHVTKVEYRRNGKADDKIKLIGTIPIKVSKDEAVPIEFKIEQIINRSEVLAKVQKLNIDTESINGKEIPKMEYGKLVIQNI
jgi:hypothetical protein